MDWITDPQSWIAFITLVALELVLGVDNIIFISILSGKLPPNQQDKARKTGIALAVFSRILLLMSLSWIIGLTKPLFTVAGFEISGRDLVLLIGGLFLMWKATHEIHQKLEGEEGHSSTKVKATFSSVLIQILLLDVVFSLDLCHHRGWDGRSPVDHDCCGDHCRRCDDMGFWTAGQLCRKASYDQNAGIIFSIDDRFHLDRRRSAPTHTQRIYLFRHGLFGICGDAQFTHARKRTKPGKITRTLHTRS